MLKMENKDMKLQKSGFSWERVWMVAKYYYPTLCPQIKWYPIAAAGLTLIVGLLQLAGGVVADASTGIIGALSFMFYWAPLVLCRYESRLTTTLLPVTAAEKAVVLFGYFFIVVPILLFGVEYAILGVFHYIMPEMSFIDRVLAEYGDKQIELRFMAKSLWIFFSVLPVMLCLWGVVHFRQNRTLKAILTSGGAYLGTSFLSAFGVMLMAFMKGFEDGRSGRGFDKSGFHDYVMGSMENMFIVIGAIALVAVVVMAIRTYKEIKNYQI